MNYPMPATEVKRWQCAVKGCTSKRPSHGGRLCSAHRSRLKRHGNVLAEIPLKKGYEIGPLSRRWAGGLAKGYKGRVMVYAPDHPRANSCGLYVLRYVLVMEKHLGRYLRDDEVVHHKNGDFTDDRIRNLQVMTRGDHTRLHLKGKKQEKLGNGKWRWKI